MSRKTMAAAVLAAAALLAPAPAFAYTCFNPAICIAVCGKKTCGKDANRNLKPLAQFSDSDMQRELRWAPRESAVADALHAVMSGKPAARAGSSTAAGQTQMSSGTAKRKGYTCWNPAICIAVCGKKTC